jgi:sulfite reductase (NADPH) flavoprotein alpha-component
LIWPAHAKSGGVFAQRNNVAEKAKLEAFLADDAAEALKTFLSERFFIDLLEEFPSAKLSPNHLLNCCVGPAKALFDCSSPKKAPHRIELTVDIVLTPRLVVRATVFVLRLWRTRIGLGQTAPVFVGESPFGSPRR